MSSSSQPRKRNAVTPGAQDDQKSSCATCEPATKNSTGKVIDLPTEKKKAVDLIHKINDKISKDPKVINKAAFIIGEWINGVSKKTSKKK